MTLWGTESVSQTGGQPIDPRLQYLGPANASGYVIQQIAPDGAMLNYPRRVGPLFVLGAAMAYTGKMRNHRPKGNLGAAKERPLAMLR